MLLLSEGLKERGYETRLVIGHETPREGNLLDMAKARGIAYEQMDGLGREIRPLSDARVVAALVRLIREFRPTIVHTHTAKAGVVGRVAALWAGVPILVHTFHGHVLRGYFGTAKTAVYRAIERALALQTDRLIAVSEGVKKDLVEMKIAPAAKFQVIPLGLELERLSGELPRGALRRESNVADDAPLIGAVGRLVPIKALEDFLEAARRVVAARPAARFAIVGDGELRSALEAKAVALGLREKVFFHGWKKDMAEVLGDLDLVVNSSLNEGTPVALIEALAAGRPVVATRVGGTPDLLGDSERGLLAPPRDPEALAGAIEDSLRDRGASHARARKGKEYVLEHHGSARLVNDVDRTYRELMAEKGLSG